MSFSVVVNGVRVKLSERMQIYLEIRRRMAEAALLVAKAAIEMALVDEVDERVGRDRYEWRFLSRSGETDWRPGRKPPYKSPPDCCKILEQYIIFGRSGREGSLKA